jgi:ABC-type sulfate/molybdate transport systems ATPase subunit
MGLLGVSGAGKTMTLRSIAGLEAPTRGRVVLNGRVLYDSATGVNLPSRARRVGLVFQNYALFPHLTAEENIRFGLGGRDAAEVHQRVAELVALFHLEGLEHRYPRQLSGGQQQRVALARALAIEPEAILLDEPLAALDTHLRSQMELRLIRILEGFHGVTVYVTHNLEEAYRISKRLLVLSAGRAAALGATDDVFRRPTSYQVARVTGCKNFSRARTLGGGRIEAVDWGCALEVTQAPPEGLAYVGVRAHHLAFAESSGAANTFPCWLARSNSTPFRTTLYLKLHAPPSSADEHHLEAEVFKDRWLELSEKPFPWYVRLDAERLFLMSE